METRRWNIWLFIICGIIFHHSVLLQGYFINTSWCFQDEGFYARDSQYDINLSSLLSSIPSEISDSGFYTDSVGSAPNMVTITAWCRADMLLRDCRGCVASASFFILHSCPFYHKAVFYYLDRTLSYTNGGLFGAHDNYATQMFRDPSNSNTDIVLLNDSLVNLLTTLRSKAASSRPALKVATGNARIAGDNWRIYAILQCMPYVSSGDCRQCLENAIELVPVYPNASNAHGICSPICRLQSATYPFYNDSRIHEVGALLGSSSGLNIINLTYIYGGPFGAVVLIYLIRAFVTYGICRRSKSNAKTVQSPVILVERIIQDVSLEHDFVKIKRATNNFSRENVLGRGGFCFVYKGTLENGDQIAVKRRIGESSQGDTEFKNEVILLGKLHHINLVKLHGFAIKGNERLLIYEFLLNGSLDKFISNPTKRGSMDWNIRRNIIEGIAKGLIYLHQDSGFRIIHRDLKPSNILLDDNMNPKVADFGLARLSRIDQSYNNTNAIAGTRGYMAPEYIRQGNFSTKSDVFNFGVLLLEIILGHERLKFILETGRDMLSFAWNSWSKKRVPEFIDPLLRARTNSAVLEEIKIFVHVGLLCVQETPEARPSMPEVLQLLNSSSITMRPPSKPGLCDTPDSSRVEQVNRNSKNEASCSNANYSDSANYMSASSHFEQVPVKHKSENEASCSKANYCGSANYMPASSHVELVPVKHKSDNEISRSNTNYYDSVECMPDSPPLKQVMMNDID